MGKFFWSNKTPAAPAGCRNVIFQSDGGSPEKRSAYTPAAGAGVPGVVPLEAALDSTKVLCGDGTYRAVSGSGGTNTAYPLETPPTSGWNSEGYGSFFTSLNAAPIYLESVSGGDCAIFRAQPNPPYSIIFQLRKNWPKILAGNSNGEENRFGIGFKNAAGLYEVLALGVNASSQPYYAIQRWSSVNVWNSDIAFTYLSPQGWSYWGAREEIFIKILNDGTNLAFFLGIAGYGRWIQLNAGWTHTIASYMGTVTEIALRAGSATSGGYSGLSLMGIRVL